MEVIQETHAQVVAQDTLVAQDTIVAQQPESKFDVGGPARQQWKKILVEEGILNMGDYNTICENKFVKRASIILDDSPKRQTTIMTSVNVDQESIWKSKNEHIYCIVRNGRIMKIGGTRTSMKERWGSYLCGHCVPERAMKSGGNFPGKMSVTNAHLYHTIEEDLLAGNSWEFWTWVLPVISVSVYILGTPTEVIAQTYHAYESRCIQKFKDTTGVIPQLCDNSDPSYNK